MRSLLFALAVPLVACDPFVAMVDEPRACMTNTAVSFAMVGGHAQASVPFDVTLGGTLQKPNANVKVALLDVELDSPQGLDFAAVAAGRVVVTPGKTPNPSASGVVAASQTPSVDGGVLYVDGDGTDLFPMLQAGPVTLTLSLDGPTQPFTADVTSCIRVTSYDAYFE